MNSAVPEPVQVPAKPAGRSIAPAMSGFSRLIRTVFSFPVFIAFSLIALTALTVQGRFDDPDLWFHLKFGQIIWTTHSIPTTDLFSSTSSGSLCIPHEWLAQLSIYATYRLAGYPGMMLWLLVSASLLLVLLYGLSCLYSGNAKVSFVGGIIGWYFATVGLTIRPLVLGHLLLVVELLLLHLGRSRDRRWFWGLPVLFTIWVNCHGTFAFGLVVLAITAACGFFELRIGPIVSSAWPPATRKILIAASIASIAALFCNPTGWKLVTFPFSVLFLQHTGLSMVQEWFPLPFWNERTPGLIMIMVGAALAAAARRVEIRLEELILVSIAAAMAVQHQRMLFLFGIMAAPVVSRLLADCWERYDAKRDLPVANAVCIAIAAIVVAASFPSQAELESQISKTSPVGAVEFIRKAHLPGPMLNDYLFGDYLMWALPEQKVFIDGRSEVYEFNGVLESFRRWAYLEEDPQIMLNKYHIQFCLLNSGNPLGNVIPYLPGWHKAYNDKQASVFVHQDQVQPPGVQ
jgi:hypothetical protein